jgi:hypothetical protein
MSITTVADTKLLLLPQIPTPGGRLTFVNNNVEVPFEVKRIYYLYDIPSGESRGGHAHKKLEQLIIAVTGSFDLIVDDGQDKYTYHLNRPNMGVYLPKGLWRELDNFSAGATCLVLASTEYLAEDYLRDYEEFLKSKEI